MSTCDHCGENLNSGSIRHEAHSFCCTGCETVFNLLHDSELGTYYTLENKPGSRMGETSTNNRFDFLEDASIRQRFIQFSDAQITRVSCSLPQIHCSSCIWLLENLNRLHAGVVSCEVNFPKRTASITFQHEQLSLKQLAELLASIGYAPNFESEQEGSTAKTDKGLYYRIGIAGFCFGNTMLLAFPEYLGIDESFADFRQFFGVLSMVLALPVVLYAGAEYFISAWNGIRQRYINMDLPIALGILTLFLRSSYEVLTATGAGYFDSLTGLVFFLLLGKWFQRKTYDAMSFERDYKSYFPIAVNKVSEQGLESTKIEELVPGDCIELRNNELIPADAVLFEGKACIDYSFVTGESDPVDVESGELLYAGGRQVGPRIKLMLNKRVDNSYLCQLWNQDAFQKKSKNLSAISDQVGKYFTMAVLLITFFTGLYWWFTDVSLLWETVSAVLIVACPCALALSVPFTLGNIIRLMGRRGLYLKHAGVVEKMATINTVVLDKTGTITYRNAREVAYTGDSLSDQEETMLSAVMGNSMHPLSTSICQSLQNQRTVKEKTKENEPKADHFNEIPGKGMSAEVEGKAVKLGSADFLGVSATDETKELSRVYVSIDGRLNGYFQLAQRYRSGLKKTIEQLKQKFAVRLLSGDHDGQREYLKQELGIEAQYFDQSPMDKLEHIRVLQTTGQNVLMLGDGLNDAGALKQSDVGMAVSDQVHQFAPACDAILDAESFQQLPSLLRLARAGVWIIYLSFLISLLYNVVGLSFAITAQLSPIVAAILMPLSSISVVLVATVATQWAARSVGSK